MTIKEMQDILSDRERVLGADAEVCGWMVIPPDRLVQSLEIIRIVDAFDGRLDADGAVVFKLQPRNP